MSRAERFLNIRIIRVRTQTVASGFHEAGIFDIPNYAFASDGLRALSPFDFYADLVAVLSRQILRDAIVGIVDVDLHNQHALSVIVPLIYGNASIQIRKSAYAAVRIEFGLVVTAADVLANDKRNTAQRGADGETVPILVHHWISAQGSYDKGITARRLYMRTYAGRQYRVTIGGIAKTGLFLVQSCSAKNPTSYAQRVIGNADFPCRARTNRGIAVFTGRQRPAPFKGTEPRLASSLAICPTKIAKPRFTGSAAVHGSDFFITFGDTHKTASEVRC